MAESIHSPNFSSPNAHNSEFAKLSHRQTFLLYGIIIIAYAILFTCENVYNIDIACIVAIILRYCPALVDVCVITKLDGPYQ